MAVRGFLVHLRGLEMPWQMTTRQNTSIKKMMDQSYSTPVTDQGHECHEVLTPHWDDERVPLLTTLDLGFLPQPLLKTPSSPERD